MQILTTIVLSTPIWVWPLLASLLWLGLGRTKTRDTSAVPLLIPPVIFGGIAIAKLALSGFALMPMFGTAGGIMVGALLVLWWRPASNTLRLADGRLRIQGEWISLGIMMLVFAANYSAGVVGSIAPQVVTGAEFQFGIALINGFSASLITSRTAAYLRTAPHSTIPMLAATELGN